MNRSMEINIIFINFKGKYGMFKNSLSPPEGG
jgi:hypothetical protein